MNANPSQKLRHTPMRIHLEIRSLIIAARPRICQMSIYEDLFALEQQHKKDVAARSRMNPDRSLNHKLFDEVLDRFETSIRNQFTCFSDDAILELRRDLVSGWLADCSLQFKAV